jgi:hypothetical protein
LNDYELIGKTKDEVNKLLGFPTETEYFKDEKFSFINFLLFTTIFTVVAWVTETLFPFKDK